MRRVIKKDPECKHQTDSSLSPEEASFGSMQVFESKLTNASFRHSELWVSFDDIPEEMMVVDRSVRFDDIEIGGSYWIHKPSDQDIISGLKRLD
jgi:hypothetical protein